MREEAGEEPVCCSQGLPPQHVTAPLRGACPRQSPKAGTRFYARGCYWQHTFTSTLAMPSRTLPLESLYPAGLDLLHTV